MNTIATKSRSATYLDTMLSRMAVGDETVVATAVSDARSAYFVSKKVLNEYIEKGLVRIVRRYSTGPRSRGMGSWVIAKL